MLTVALVLAVSAFVCVVLDAMGKCPLWVAVLLLAVLELLRTVAAGL